MMASNIVELNPSKREIEVTPKHEQAIRMYALGKFKTQAEAAALAGCHPNWFNQVLQSPGGQAIMKAVRSELELRMDGLYNKFVDTIEDALDDVDMAVRLAGANLYAKTQVGTKVKIELSAEDIIKQIMDGTYQAEQA